MKIPKKWKFRFKNSENSEMTGIGIFSGYSSTSKRSTGFFLLSGFFFPWLRIFKSRDFNTPDTGFFWRNLYTWDFREITRIMQNSRDRWKFPGIRNFLISGSGFFSEYLKITKLSPGLMKNFRASGFLGRMGSRQKATSASKGSKKISKKKSYSKLAVEMREDFGLVCKTLA